MIGSNLSDYKTKKNGFIFHWHVEYGSYINEYGSKISLQLTLISILCCLCAVMEIIYFSCKQTFPFILADASIFLIQSTAFMTAASSIVKEISDETATYAYTMITMGLYIFSLVIMIMSFFAAVLSEIRRNSLESLSMGVLSICVTCVLTTVLRISTFNKIPFKFEHFCFGKRFLNLNTYLVVSLIYIYFRL